MEPSIGDYRRILLFVTGTDAQDLADLVNSLVGFYLGEIDIDFSDWVCQRIESFSPLNVAQGWVLVNATYEPTDENGEPIKKPRA